MPALTLVVAAILAAGGWAIANAVAGSSHPSAAAGSEASVLASLSPQNRSYVKAITELTPRQIAAAFGTTQSTTAGVLASLSPQNRRYVEGITALTTQQIAAAFATTQTTAGVLASLSPQNRRYVEAITALTPRQIAAAFGAGS
jgi:glutamate-1-semialdehyde aminotransferase